MMKQAELIEKTLRESNKYDSFMIMDLPLLSKNAKEILAANQVVFLSELKEILLQGSLLELDGISEESVNEIILAVIVMCNSESFEMYGNLKARNLFAKKVTDTPDETKVIEEDITEKLEIPEIFPEKEVIAVMAENITTENETDISDKDLIKYVLIENKYNTFLRFVDSRGLTYMSEINDSVLEDFKNYKGVGITKYHMMIETMEAYKNGTLAGQRAEEEEEDCEDAMFENIHSTNHNLDIEVLRLFNIKPKALNSLKRKNINTVGDLCGKSNVFIERTVGSHYYVRMLDLVEILAFPIEKVVEKTLEMIRQKDINYGMYVNRAIGCTLQEVGNEFGVTRERIRQIVEKLVRKFEPLQNAIMDYYAEAKGYVSADELMSICSDEESGYILLYIAKNNDKYYYLDFAEKFVIDFDEAKEKEAYERISDIVGEGAKLSLVEDDIQEILDTRYPYMSVADAANLLKKYDYHMYGNYLMKGRVSYGKLCANIVAEKYPNGISIYDSGELENLRNILREEYNYPRIPEEDRALSARAIEFLVLNGKGLYTAKENVHIDIHLMSKIKEYIDKSDDKRIYYFNLFGVFEEQLRQHSNIDNYNFLHGALKLYYPNDYDYNDRDFLSKIGDNYEEMNLEEKLRRFIVEKGRAVSFKEVNKFMPGVSMAVINGLLASDCSLFPWEFNHFTCREIIQISDVEKERMRIILDEQVNQSGFYNAQMLYDEVIPYRFEFIEKNNIKNASNLFYICAELFGELYDFDRPIISRKGMFKENTWVEILEHMVRDKDVVSYKEIINVSKEMKISQGTIYNTWNKIEKNYFRLNEEDYIKAEKLPISEEALKQISQALADSMSMEMLIIRNFNKWDELPNLGYEWNTYLLHSIIENCLGEYRIVEPALKDRRYEKGIVVKKESQFMGYDEVVVTLLLSEGKKELSEGEMLDWLLKNKLTYKTIPVDLYQSECISYKKEIFYVE